MGQPHGEIPRVTVDIAAFVTDNGNFDVRVTVRGGDLGNHGLRDGNGGLTVFPARNAHHAPLEQIHGHRHALEHTEIFLKLSGLIGERIVHKGEALFRYLNGSLKGKVSNAKADREEVVIRVVPVPKEGGRAVQRTAFVRAQGALPQRLRVVFVQRFDFVPHTDEVLTVTLKAAVFQLAAGFAGVAYVHQRPERGDKRGRDRRNDTHVHKRRRAGTVAEDRERASENHRYCHSQRRTDLHGKGLVLRFL